ncbi:MAG: hypothetical protein V5A20_00535 [Salinibacter sp.]|uniref:hypothetical protein n=1 Tax=Salinibacter sp. TaxID=2065818 RepID=UPI002FC34DB3
MIAVTGCDSNGPSAQSGTVEVGFGTAHSSSSQNTLKAQATRQSVNSDTLVLTGSNGTLEITDVRLIVDEIDLEGDADNAEFETERPAFLNLPLEEGQVSPVADDQVPQGSYEEFEFEIEDVELDDPDEEGEIQNLRDEIRNEFPAWPNVASMVVAGTFTPSNDTSRTFETYFEAEIEVERELSPPLEVTSEGFSRELIVRLDPAQWFQNADGTVQDLSQSNFADTGTVIEFEAEFEDGVSEVEFGD